MNKIQKGTCSMHQIADSIVLTKKQDMSLDSIFRYLFRWYYSKCSMCLVYEVFWLNVDCAAKDRGPLQVCSILGDSEARVQSYRFRILRVP